MKKIHQAFLGLVFLASIPVSLKAQSLTFDHSLTFGANSFTTDANGLSTLSLSTSDPAYHADLNAFLGVAAASGIKGAGWVFDDGTNSVVITQNGGADSMASDPFVTYGYAFINETGGPSNFSMSFTSNFAPVTPDQTSLVRATFGLSLTDGSGQIGTGVTANATQTGLLGSSNPLTSIDAGVTLNSGNQTASAGGTTTAQFQTLGAPNFIAGPGGGPYDSLTAIISGTYSAGAVLAVTGRVDAVPEPSSFALFAGSIVAALILHFRRFARI